MISMQAFESIIPNLAAKDQSFAHSLLAGWKKYGRLTPGQSPWPDKLAARLNQTTAIVAPLTPLADMCKAAAAKGLKRPKVRMSHGAALYVFSLAKNTSRNPGYLYVKRDGEYAGKVSPAGEYSGDDSALPALQAFASDPVKAAAEHGKLTGCCSFCNRVLTDPVSVERGYGPICRSNFGLG